MNSKKSEIFGRVRLFGVSCLALATVITFNFAPTGRACVQGPTQEALDLFTLPFWYYTCAIGGCSGSLARGKRVVLTAAHCIGSDAGTKWFWRCYRADGQYLGTAQGSYAVTMSGWNGGNATYDMGYNVTRTPLSSGDTIPYVDNWTLYNSGNIHIELGYPGEQGWNNFTPAWCAVSGANHYSNTPGDPAFWTTAYYMLGGMSGGPAIERWDMGWGFRQIGINNWSDRCNNAGSRRIDSLATSLLNGAPTN